MAQFTDADTMIVLVDDNSLGIGTVLQAAVWPYLSLPTWHNLSRKLVSDVNELCETLSQRVD